MKRKLKWLSLILTVLLLGFGMVLFLWPRDRISAANCELIRMGMTEKEVEDLLGGRGMTPPFEVERLKAGPGLPPSFRFWIGRNGFIQIEFDNNGHVIDKDFHLFRTSSSNIIDRLRDWLGW